MRVWRALIIRVPGIPGNFMNPVSAIVMAKTKAGAKSRLRSRLEEGQVIYEMDETNRRVFVGRNL